MTSLRNDNYSRVSQARATIEVGLISWAVFGMIDLNPKQSNFHYFFYNICLVLDLAHGIFDRVALFVYPR